MAAVVTRLPAAVVGKTPNPIKRKTRGKPGFRRLPFVAGWRTESASPCWNVPASGGYFGGYETGEAMAQAFLKFLREEKGDFPAYWLTGIVESFMTRFEQEGGKARRSGASIAASSTRYRSGWRPPPSISAPTSTGSPNKTWCAAPTPVWASIMWPTWPPCLTTRSKP